MDYKMLLERIADVRSPLDELEELAKKLKTAGPLDREDLECSIARAVKAVKGAADDLNDAMPKKSR